jgi:Ribbon-helix-helix protein, copG family.
MVYLGKRQVRIMKPLKNKVSITLDEDIIQHIKKLAEEDDRSFSQYINMVLKEHIAKQNGDAGGMEA